MSDNSGPEASQPGPAGNILAMHRKARATICREACPALATTSFVGLSASSAPRNTDPGFPGRALVGEGRGIFLSP